LDGTDGELATTRILDAYPTGSDVLAVVFDLRRARASEPAFPCRESMRPAWGYDRSCSGVPSRPPDGLEERRSSISFSEIYRPPGLQGGWDSSFLGPAPQAGEPLPFQGESPGPPCKTPLRGGNGGPGRPVKISAPGRSGGSQGFVR